MSMKKRILTVGIAFMMLVVCIGASMSDYIKMNHVEAEEETVYVAELSGTGGEIRAYIPSQKNTEYEVTFDYYLKSDVTGSNAVVSFYPLEASETSRASVAIGDTEVNRKKSATITYNTENQSWLRLSIKNNTQSTLFYIWNIQVKEAGTQINPSTSNGNYDFKHANGNWFNWTMLNYNSSALIYPADQKNASAQTGHTVRKYADLDFLQDVQVPNTCAWDGTGKQLTFQADTEFNLQSITQYHLQQDGKAFIGWKDQDGKWLTSEKLYGYVFSKDTSLVAQYIDCDTNLNGDFSIRTKEMRTDGTLGVRFVVELSDNLRANLPNVGEYGTLVLPSEILNANSWAMNGLQNEEYSGQWADLTYDGVYVYNDKEYTPAIVKAENTYQTSEDGIYYTLCITNLTEEKYDRQYTVKGYIKYIDMNGKEQVLYTNYASTNPYVASQDALKGEITEEAKTVLETITSKMSETYKEERAALEANKVTLTGSEDDKTTWMYELENGIRVREAVFNSGKNDGKSVEIIQLTDLHYNYMNALDFAEANPTLLSTYQYRTWAANAQFAPLTRKLLEYSRSADQLVITGDVLDYLSQGTVELFNREIWDKYPNTLVTPGNHEYVQKCEGKVDETLTWGERRAWLNNIWKHNKVYTSKVIGDRAMVIQLNNGAGMFDTRQIDKLQADISTARAKGYVVLIFTHQPLVTGNANDTAVQRLYSGNYPTYDFYSYRPGETVHPDKDDTTKSVYEIITSNADVIKGIFNGHVHTNFYTEIAAKTSVGESAIIPQYSLTSSVFDEGYALKITVY